LLIVDRTTLRVSQEFFEVARQAHALGADLIARGGG
jgi:hypothetical protein